MGGDKSPFVTSSPVLSSQSEALSASSGGHLPKHLQTASPVWGQDLLSHVHTLPTPLLVTGADREADTPTPRTTSYDLSEEMAFHRGERLDSKATPLGPLHPHGNCQMTSDSLEQHSLKERGRA